MLFDEDLYNYIVRKHKTELQLYILNKINNNPHLAEEITQEVFILLFEKWVSLKNLDNIRTWLFRTSDNYIRRKRRELFKSEKYYFEFNEYEKNNSSVVYNEFNKDSYEKYLYEINKALNDEQQKIFHYYFIKGLKIVEISNLMDIPHSTLRHKIMRIKEIIQPVITHILDNEIT